MNKRSQSTRRAAVLLSSLPQRQQTQILSQLPIDQAQQLTEAITGLGDIPTEEKRKVLNDFHEESRESEPSDVNLRKDAAHASHPAAERSEPDKETDPNNKIDFDEVVQADNIFGFLEETTIEQAARALKDEDPQSIAIVLSRLEPSRAARIFMTFDLDWRLAIVRRQAKSTVVSAKVGLSIAERIRQRLNLDFANDERKGGLSSLVSMLGCIEDTARQTLIDCLTVSDLSLARTIRDQCLVFDDLAKIPDEEFKELFEGMDTLLIVSAFSQCKPLTLKKLLANMAPVAAELALGEIEQFQPESPDQVEQAQQTILDLVFAKKNRGQQRAA